jgi:hypothetical protein
MALARLPELGAMRAVPEPTRYLCSTSESGPTAAQPAWLLRADIVAKVPNCTGVNLPAVKKIRPTIADSCALNRITEVVS